MEYCFDKGKNNLILYPARKNDTDYSIPNTVTAIEVQAFSDCESLTSVTIPNSVSEIGWRAFEYCSSLTSIALPNCLENLEAETFYDCKNIRKVEYHTEKPVTATEDVFPPTVYENATLYVPEGALSAYENTTPWRYFLNKVETTVSGVILADVKELTDAEYYSIGGLYLGRNSSDLAPGIYIVRHGNTMKKITIK